MRHLSVRKFDEIVSFQIVFKGSNTATIPHKIC